MWFVIDWLPDSFIEFLVRFEAAGALLLIAIIGGWIAGTLAGRRSAKYLEKAAAHMEQSAAILRDLLIESIQPALTIQRLSRINRENAVGHSFRIQVSPWSRPARLIRTECKLRCERHGKEETTTLVLPGPDTFTAPGGQKEVQIWAQWETCDRNCLLTVLSFAAIFSDYKRLQAYRRDLSGHVTVVEDATTRDSLFVDKLVQRLEQVRKKVQYHHQMSTLASRVRGWFSKSN